MAKKKLRKGLFITFEGPEGSGKSTISLKIMEWLKREGYDCLFTREPGGTFVGEKMREILLNPANKDISPLTELFLFETSRCQLVQEVIRPALLKKKLVIADRFTDSTVAYQGYAGKVPFGDVMKMNALATGGLEPDLTVLLDVDPRIGFARAAKYRKKDRMELKALKFHRMVRRGYLELARRSKGRIRTVSSSGSLDDTYKLVEAVILKKLEGHGK